jgi:hypothetical protein
VAVISHKSDRAGCKTGLDRGLRLLPIGEPLYRGPKMFGVTGGAGIQGRPRERSINPEPGLDVTPCRSETIQKKQNKRQEALSLDSEGISRESRSPTPRKFLPAIAAGKQVAGGVVNS